MNFIELIKIEIFTTLLLYNCTATSNYNWRLRQKKLSFDGTDMLNGKSKSIRNIVCYNSLKEERNGELAQRLISLIDQNSDRRLSIQEIHAFANINAKVKISTEKYG